MISLAFPQVWGNFALSGHLLRLLDLYCYQIEVFQLCWSHPWGLLALYNSDWGLFDPLRLELRPFRSWSRASTLFHTQAQFGQENPPKQQTKDTHSLLLHTSSRQNLRRIIRPSLRYFNGCSLTCWRVLLGSFFLMTCNCDFCKWWKEENKIIFMFASRVSWARDFI